MTQDDVVFDRVTAQVEVAVLHADVVAAVADVFDGERRHLRGGQNLERLDLQFDVACRVLRVFRLAFHHDAFGLDDEFTSDLAGGLHRLSRANSFLHKQLRDTITVAQINPQQGAFVADTLHPAAQCDFLTHVGHAKFTTCMSSKHIVYLLYSTNLQIYKYFGNARN